MIEKRDDMSHLTSREKELCKEFKKMSDEQLLKLIAWQVNRLGHLPAKYEAECVRYLKNRFGPWPRLLERAGVKPVSQTKLNRQYAAQRRRKRLLKRVAGSTQSVEHQIADHNAETHQ